MKRRWLLLFAATLWAQDGAFKIDVKLVVANVSVTDRNGNPITNLKREDFEVFEDGARQMIASFDLQTLSCEPLPTIVLPKRSAAPEDRLNAGEWTVIDPKRFHDRRLIAMLFDLTSMQPAEQARALEAATKFVDSQMTASDLVSIMSLAPGFRIFEDFTDDREILIRALRKIDSAEMAKGAGILHADAGRDTEFDLFNTVRGLKALEAAVRGLGTYPQQKALIYLSSGIPRTGIENLSQLKATVNSAIHSHVSFYPIDARGLVALPPGGDASTASPSGAGILTGAIQQSLLRGFNHSQETLYTLAADTGGKALLNSNDLTLGMRQAQKDMSSYYMLGYYSTNAADDGAYRRIRIRLANNLEARLQYRDGYYAESTAQRSARTLRKDQIDHALKTGEPITELPLAVEVDYFRVAADQFFAPISIKIPSLALGIAQTDRTQPLSVDYIGRVRDSSGTMIAEVRDRIAVPPIGADRSRIDRHYLQYDTGVTVRPGLYNLIFLVRENRMGKIGTFETNVKIPDYTAETSLAVSSVILSAQIEPLPWVGGATAAANLQLLHPLVHDEQKMIPSITRVFSQNQTLYIYFEVYDPAVNSDDGRPSLIAELSLLSGNRKAFTSEPVRLNQLVTSRPGVASFRFQVPLLSLKPGEYVSQVSVIDEMGHKFAFLRNSIVLLP